MEDGLDMYANDDAYRAGLDSNTAVQSLEEAEAVSREQILSLCRDVPAECAEDGILRILYGFITDSEKRNAEGLAPLMAKVDRVKAAAGPGPAIRRRGRRSAKELSPGPLLPLPPPPGSRIKRCQHRSRR